MTKTFARRTFLTGCAATAAAVVGALVRPLTGKRDAPRQKTTWDDIRAKNVARVQYTYTGPYDCGRGGLCHIVIACPFCGCKSKAFFSGGLAGDGQHCNCGALFVGYSTKDGECITYMKKA